MLTFRLRVLCLERHSGEQKLTRYLGSGFSQMRQFLMVSAAKLTPVRFGGEPSFNVTVERQEGGVACFLGSNIESRQLTR
jgi:hypothetical protein